MRKINYIKNDFLIYVELFKENLENDLKRNIYYLKQEKIYKVIDWINDFIDWLKCKKTYKKNNKNNLFFQTITSKELLKDLIWMKKQISKNNIKDIIQFSKNLIKWFDDEYIYSYRCICCWKQDLNNNKKFICDDCKKG